MNRIKIYLALLIATMTLGLVSCDDELAQPPVNIPEGGIGTGAWNNPMTTYQVMLGTVNDALATPWVKGYIVGYVDTNVGTVANAESCKFTVPATVYTNILIAATPDERNWENCATVQLPSGDVRRALNLGDHPENQGLLVSMKGTTGSKYCGVYGVRSVTAYNWGEEGLDDGSDVPQPDQPVVTGTTVYTGLEAAASEVDWTYDNVVMPSPLSYVWSWKEYNGNHYLNASAYYSGKNIAAEAYAYSPVIDLTDYSSAAVVFEHAAKFQTTLRELCRFVVREEGTTAWTELDIPVWPSEGVWTFSESGVIDLTAFAGKKIVVGFKYASSEQGADTWEIKNVKVTGVKK